MRIHLYDYVQNVDSVDRVSISHWGMFPLVVPKFNQIIEDDVPDLKGAVFSDFAFGMPSLMRGMKRFKEEVASYANKLT